MRFFYRYRWQGNVVQLSIGDYPNVTLAQARDRRQEFRAWLENGYDPRQQLLVEKVERTDALTVEQAFHYWIDNYCRPEGIIKTDVDIQVFNKHVKPSLGNARIDQTDKGHWLTVFDGIGRTGEVLFIMKRAFRFCSNRGVINANQLSLLENPM